MTRHGARQVIVLFTEDEAQEILLRCLNSAEEDTSAFNEAVRKLADALVASDRAQAA